MGGHCGMRRRCGPVLFGCGSTLSTLIFCFFWLLAVLIGFDMFLHVFHERSCKNPRKNPNKSKNVKIYPIY